jgi:hypothetical protein
MHKYRMGIKLLFNNNIIDQIGELPFPGTTKTIPDVIAESGVTLEALSRIYSMEVVSMLTLHPLFDKWKLIGKELFNFSGD